MKKTRAKAKKLVSSKSEIMKPPLSKHTLSLRKYRGNIKDMAKRIKNFAMRDLNCDNLLSIKMALMQAVRDIEDMMRERREKE